MSLYVAEYHVNTKYSIVLLDKLLQGYKVIWEVSFQFCHPIWLRRKIVNYSLVSAIYTDRITAMAHSLIKKKKNKEKRLHFVIHWKIFRRNLASK